MLEVHNLWMRGPDGAVALADLTIFAHAGDLLALLGGHGAGKSAALRAIAGLARAESGSVRLDGVELSGLGPHVRAARGITFLGDGDRIVERLSVHENLLVGAWRRRDRRSVRRDLANWFERFPALAAARRRPAADLGIADRAAVALGRAWIAGPRVVLVDEPFAGLAGESRAGIAAALRAARDAGLIVICAMHDPDGAAVADRINLLSSGRVVFSGSPGALAAAGAPAFE